MLFQSYFKVCYPHIFGCDSSCFINTEWEFEGVSVPSGVADQPMSQEETLYGAVQRAENARKAIPDADFWVGIEGGVATENQEMEVFAWIYVLSKAGHSGKSRTANFYLPPQIQELVAQGIELGTADDMVFKQENSKQQGGSVGILTDGNIDRTAYYQTNLYDSGSYSFSERKLVCG